MNYVWYSIPLLLLITIPGAYAQVENTTGENYDLVENFFTGEAQWTSHVPRIMDGEWKNYVLENNSDKVIFNSNSIGSFVYDKNSCSYSIYENGYVNSNTQIIPSVSAVATHNDGTWTNMDVNDSSCDVTVSQYGNGITLTSTKVITQDTTEDIFISYTGTTENFYANSTNSQFTLISNSTGNQGYFNGQTNTIIGSEIEKFVQRINLDINKGIKETFYIYDDTDSGNELGISQTIHVGPSIVMGTEQIQISDFDGMSFDKAFIVDNEAEILEVASNLNYDFDEGIDSLTSVNIIHESEFLSNTYKVNLDYASGGFVGYLEIDPTFTSSTGTINTINTGFGSSSSCPAPSSVSSGIYKIKLPQSSNSGSECKRADVYFDTSSLPNIISITNTELTYDVSAIHGNGGVPSVDWTELLVAPSTQTTQDRWDEISDNTVYVSSDTNSQTVASNYVKDLGVNADTDLENLLQNNETWFGLGGKTTSEVRSGTATQETTFTNLILTVEYSIPIAPQSPTNLSTVTGIPIELDWDATPTSGNGGSAIISYKVFRTLNEFAQVELPNSSGSDSELTFSDNEFLIHGFESDGTTLQDKSTNSVPVTFPSIDITHVSTTRDTSQTTYSSDGSTMTHYGGEHFTDSKWRNLELKSIVVYGSKYTSSSSGDYKLKVFGSDHSTQIGSTITGTPSVSSMPLNSAGVSNTIVTFDLTGITSPNTEWFIGVGAISSGGAPAYVFFDSAGTGDGSNYWKNYNGYTDYPSQSLGFSLDYVGSVTPTSTTGSIGTALQDPNLVYTDTDLPDNTDTLSVGGFVKLDETPITFSTDFTDGYFTELDSSKITESGGVLNINSVTDGSKDNAYYNVGTTDDTWVLRGEWHTTSGMTAGAQYLKVGIVDDGANVSGNNNPANGVHWAWQNHGSSGGNDKMAIYCTGGGATYSSTGLLSNGADYYWTLTQTSASTVTLSVKTGSHSGTEVISLSESGCTHTGIDDITIWNRDNSGTGSIVGTMDNFEFNNGSTSAEPSPPANTKLLGLNDVTFNVGTTTASVDALTTATATFSEDFSSSTGWTVGRGQSIDTTSGYLYSPYCSGSTASQDCHAFKSYAIGSPDKMVLNWDWKFGGADFKLPFIVIASDASTSGYYGSIGTPSSGEKKIVIKNNNDKLNVNFLYYVSGASALSDSWTSDSATPTANTMYYFQFIKDGDDISIKRYGSITDRTSQTNEQQTLTGTLTGAGYTGTDDLAYIVVGSYGGYGGSAGENYMYDFELYNNVNSLMVQSPFISATGLTDNTSTPQHYAVTRDSSNLWTIYQNGVSKATATDSTSLGSNAGTTGSESYTTSNDDSKFETGTTQYSVIGQQITSGNPLIGQSVDEISFYLYQNGAGSSTDTVSFGVWDSSGNLKGSVFGTTDISTFNSGTAHTDKGKVTQTGTGVTISADDTIGARINQAPSGYTVYFATQNSDGYSNAQRSIFVEGSSPTTYARDVNFEASWTVPVDYTTNLSGSLDEFFINSDTLTSTEIENIYERGVAPTLLTTTIPSVTEYDDSTAVGGNEYFFSVQAVNNIGSSPYITPFVSGLGGVPWNVPQNLSAIISDANATPLLINLSWDASIQGSGTGTLTGYELFKNGVSIGTVGTVTSSTHQLSTPGTNNFTILSISSHGNSATGNVASVTTPTAPGISTLTTAINNPNTTPLAITSTFVPGTTGGSAINSYNLYFSDDNTTYTSIVNNTTTNYTYTASTPGTKYFKSEAVNNVGIGPLSVAHSITTPTVPDAITDLSGSAVSDTRIDISFSQPSNGGSALNLYKIFKDGTQVDTTTNLTYSLTGLTSNTAYAITVYSNNNVGDSLVSNTATITTHTSISGSITITKSTVGATSKLEFTPSVTGTPTPNFNLFTLKEGSTVLASGISSPYYLAHNDFNSHTYTITSYDGTHWNTPTISGTTTAQSGYDPTWKSNVSYNYTRASNVMDLTVNRDSQILWDASCNYRTTAEVMNDGVGLTSNSTGVWYISESQNISDIDTVYVNCVDGSDVLFSFTSFGPNRLGGGIAQLDAVFGDFTGTPVALIFVLLVAGLFTGRSAPTGILLVLALVGVLGFVGMLTIDEAVWGFLLLAGVLGIFLGKRFL